jgi:hypothetical protein
VSESELPAEAATVKRVRTCCKPILKAQARRAESG